MDYLARGGDYVPKLRRNICRKKRRHHLRNKRKDLDTHHIFYTKRSWKNPSLSVLRRFHYCRISIPKDTLHKTIHARVPEIPTPRSISAQEALKHLKLLEEHGSISDKDPLERRLLVLTALFAGNETKTAEALYKQMCVVRDFYEDNPCTKKQKSPFH